MTRPAQTPPPNRAWFGHPAASVMVGVGWLLLQQSLALPQLITALVLGLAVPRLIHRFLDLVVLPRRPLAVLRLSGVVILDIIQSNLAVARIALSPYAKPRPAWIRVPMELRHPLAQTLLASIITNTPGTVACTLDEATHEITVHVLDCDDPDQLLALIRQRYELPLKEILG